MRADDLPLLEEIRDRLEARKIYGPYNEAGRSPVVNWTVLSRQDLPRTVAALDEHPPRGRKAIEYRFWKEAVELYTASSGRGGMAQQRLLTLRRELKRTRAYPHSPPKGT
jgi:hypothetical protein